MIRAVPRWEEISALRPEAAAAFWLVRFDGEETAGDKSLFERWLTASDANALAWHSAQDTWASFDEGDDGHDNELTAMLREARASTDRPPARRWVPYLAVAGALFVAILLGVQWLGPRAGRGGPVQLAETTNFHHATKVGERATFRLPDGSEVTLDTGSTVEGRFAGGRRDLTLVAGQAFFKVAHDPAHPFRVTAGGQVVTARGTSFNLRLDGDALRVALLEGVVTVAPVARGIHTELTLHPGQEALVRDGHYTLSATDLTRRVQWRDGLATFDDETLFSVVAELNRYGGTRLVIRDPSVGQLRVSGAFRTGDNRSFAENIRQLYPVRSLPHSDDTIEFVPAPR